MTEHLAYLGPGAGFAFLGSFLALVVSILASVASLLAWPFRLAWRTLRKTRLKTPAHKVIILGLDGFDPNLAERWMQEGKLPNLSRLREQGTYSRLRTTFPALSPVAWSTFATGVNPARHNIFDFLNRDLRTYAPELSSAKVHPPRRFIKIAKWLIPLDRPTTELRRKSEPFWKLLGRSGISSTILRVPITFPPEPFDGRMLSAMSTPDLRGTQGSFSWFTTDKQNSPVEGGLRLSLRSFDGYWEGTLAGPGDASLPFRLQLESPQKAQLTINNETHSLTLAEYSPWIRLRFPTGLTNVRGIVRFLLVSTHPQISLYVTPIEIDPENPALPISYPTYYSIYLAKLLGAFATLGMAEDTWALNEGAIDEEAFLKQAKLIQAERESMFFSALDHTRRGVVACVFDTSDRVQHMFYRHLDASRAEDKHHGVIEDLYCDLDRLVGQTMKFVDNATTFFVLSDHGFCAFRRGVNLNSWLVQNGYLTLNEGLQEGGEYFAGIDWSRTRAYTFGLGGLYLNLRGREAQGIVPRENASELRKEIQEKLTGLMDQEEIAIRQVYDSEKIYSGPYLDAAPDLVIGYAAGYRASWSAAVGKVTRDVFETNTKCWSGDHCVDPTLVPGVLFSNRKMQTTDAGIEDIAPTVLQLFGIAAPGWMEGRAFGVET